MPSETGSIFWGVAVAVRIKDEVAANCVCSAADVAVRTIPEIAEAVGLAVDFGVWEASITAVLVLVAVRVSVVVGVVITVMVGVAVEVMVGIAVSGGAVGIVW
jgi:hypothetical protein